MIQTITEPITMVTDYAIALEAAVFAIALFKVGHSRQQTSIWLWAIAFSLIVVAASSGGTWHGFARYLGNRVEGTLWYVTTYFISFAGFFMLSATVISTLTQRLQKWFLIGAVVKSLTYIFWATTHNDFTYVVVDYLSTMAIVLILQVKAIFYHYHTNAVWIIAGIIVSFVAAHVLQIGFSVANSVSSNDTYHFIQMGALYLFYRGACA